MSLQTGPWEVGAHAILLKEKEARQHSCWKSTEKVLLDYVGLIIERVMDRSARLAGHSEGAMAHVLLNNLFIWRRFASECSRLLLCYLSQQAKSQRKNLDPLSLRDEYWLPIFKPFRKENQGFEREAPVSLVKWCSFSKRTALCKS